MTGRALCSLLASAAMACGGSGDSGGGAGGQPPIGTIAISWMMPTRNADGSTPADVAGYRVRYGSAPAQLTSTIDVPGAAATSARINGLSPGTYYVIVETLNAAQVASDPSNPASITLR